MSRSMACVLGAELLLGVAEGRFVTGGRREFSRVLGFSVLGFGGPLESSRYSFVRPLRRCMVAELVAA